jgi:hypothetical protein
MNNEEMALIKAKKIECWIGMFFLIPAILGVIAFTFQMLGENGAFVELRNLSYKWIARSGDTGGGMSAAPIYMGIMALAGAYLIKDSLKYLFMSYDEKKEVTQETPKPEE